jgi:hypothetical protein
MSSNTDDLLSRGEQAFGTCIEPHRRELHVHCYRLRGPFEEAEDLAQEAFLCAWRRSETYEARASVRAWLYRIATAAERELLARYVECGARVDTKGLAALLHEDVHFSMPSTPGVWTGRSTVVRGWIAGGFGSEAFGSMRCVVPRANAQPALACSVRKPGDAACEPPAIDVLRLRDVVLTEIVTFDRAVFGHFDLPAMLSAADGTK